MVLKPKTKKLIGAIAILAWLPVYTLIAVSAGIRVLPHAGGLAQFVYYAIAGMAWIVPIGLMLPWMSREAPRRDRLAADR